MFHEGFGGGASEYVLRVVPQLRERGWDLRFYVDQPGRLAERLEALGYAPAGRRRLVGFSARWWRRPPGPAVKLRSMPAWFAGLARWLRRERPALVHANSLYSLPDALVARTVGMRVYLQLHEMLPAGRKGALARSVILRSGIAVGAVSQASARRFAGDDGPLPAIVRGGTPLPALPAARGDGSGPYVVGTVGWVCERKGSDVFVDLVERVRAERDDVEFRLVGDAERTAPDYDWSLDVLARARQAGITHIPRADVFDELSTWDVMVLPSRFDPYPLTVMEAMAMGVPVVASAVDGIIEQVVPGTGRLVAAEDSAGLAAAVTELLDAPAEDRVAMRAAARAHAERAFTLERQVDALARAWTAAIERGR